MPDPLRQHLPNLITAARLVLAGGFFIVLSGFRYPDHNVWALNVAAGIFLLAVVTDVLDGYLARRWGAVTTFGRVMDPLCDKVLIIGALIFLAGPQFAAPRVGGGEHEEAEIWWAGITMASGIYPWMVVVILIRELLVTGLRGLAESRGVRFAATISGKAKMVLQSTIIPAVILLVAHYDPMAHPEARMLRDVLVYAMVLVTVFSGIPYVIRSAGMMRE